MADEKDVEAVYNPVAESIEDRLAEKGSPLDLSGANLKCAFMWHLKLPGTDLTDASLQGARLNDTDLCGSSLRGAKFKGADLRGSNLRGADMHGADLRGAKLDQSAHQWASTKNLEHARGLPPGTFADAVAAGYKIQDS